MYSSLFKIKPYIDDVFNIFYDILLQNTQFKEFFDSDEQVKNLVNKQKKNFINSLSDSEESFKNRYLYLGKFHYDVFIPYIDFMKGTDILMEEFLKITAKSHDVNLVQVILDYFRKAKAYMAKGYLNCIIEKDKKDIAIFINLSQTKKVDATRNMAKTNLEWLKRLIEAIESEDVSMAPDLDYRSCTYHNELINSKNIAIFEKMGLNEEYILGLHKRIHIDAQNIFLFISKQDYSEALPLYASLMSVFKFSLILNNSLILSLAKNIEELNDDLEERVKFEVKKRSEHEELLIQQSKMAMMGEMINSIAHQWKQPLSSIAILTEDLKDAYDTNELNKNYMDDSIDSILRQLKFMSQTVDDFKSFLKPSKNKISFSIYQVTKEVINILLPQLKKVNIKIDLIESEDILLYGYPNEFKQVIMNIVVNAKDEIVDKSVKNGYIKIYTQNDKIFKLMIEDNGNGISTQNIDKIFEPYFSTKSSGSGIGLYMSKKIVENMGGDLRVENIKNGARFTIEFKKNETAF